MKNTIDYYTEYKDGSRFMECRTCGALAPVSNDTSSTKCHLCVREDYNKDFPFTPPKSYASSGRPRGWKFMKEFVDSKGTVFIRGVEMPLLKGTLPPTVIKPKPIKPKLTKGQKAQLYNDTLSAIHKLKKQLSKAKFKKDQKRITSEIKKLQKLVR
tara:strand:+ start:825 stop:1292 length:468 start_codon:yes stop_codon:yes gene_type:complete